jgi:hypothetical protein
MLVRTVSPNAGEVTMHPPRKERTMRKHALVVVFVAVVTCLAVLAPSASALRKPRLFTLLEVERGSRPVGDCACDRPPVSGDQAFALNDLYRWTGKRGIHVGHDRVLTTFITGFGPTFSHRALALFEAQVYLPDGTLFGEGYGALPPDGPGKFKVPVVGGTGVYENARGYVNVRDNGRGRTLLEFHLSP